jgi:uncharacterized protein (DUF4415 family)
MPSKRKIVPVTREEDAAINRAAASDPDARELTDAELARMRPAREVLPEILGQKNADALMKRRGRPALSAEERKVPLNMRADPDVVEALRATGEGWQTRINDLLRNYVKAQAVNEVRTVLVLPSRNESLCPSLLSPAELLSVARQTGLRTYLQGVPAPDARALLSTFFIAALQRAGLATEDAKGVEAVRVHAHAVKRP